MALKTVKTFARTMLAVERLVAAGATGPRSAKRRSASASLRPCGTAERRFSVTTAEATPGAAHRRAVAKPRYPSLGGSEVRILKRADGVASRRRSRDRESGGADTAPRGVRS